ncbi:hypothetical protein OAV60_03375 [Paracoccaceae bacterium]|nr:hypothetical protein [Paracoccaceae bacterium]
MSDILNILENIATQPRLERRLSQLAGWGRDVSMIKTGLRDVESRLDAGRRSFVIYGEPQSGKTEFMIALTCKLLDQGYKTIFVIMNDNTELEEQNFKRFKRCVEINPSPMRAFEFSALPDKDRRTEVQRVIFCRKNASNLRKLISDARFLTDRIVIDDEADFASPDTKINRDGDPSTINDLVEKLGDLGVNGSGKYIGVTATPGRLDLNNTFMNDSRDWVFLESHSSYVGRSFFFPITPSDRQKSNFLLTKLPENGDDPKHLREAFLRFLVRNAALNIRDNAQHPKGYSMLIHTAGKTHDHEEDRAQIQKYLSILQNKTLPEVESYYKYMKAYAERIVVQKSLSFDYMSILSFIHENIGRSSILIINHKNDRGNVESACNPSDIFTFAIGGNIVSRGLTFENLLTFFFSRNVKGKMQQNTYIQRARMFGNRPYADYFELCVPGELYGSWADCFADHEWSLQAAKTGNYVHFASKKNTPADAASIDKKNVFDHSGEFMLGGILSYSKDLREYINSESRYPLTDMERYIDACAIKDPSISSFIASIRGLVENEASEVCFVLDDDGGFPFIEVYKDADFKNIERARGGMIHAKINKRKKYDGFSHFILPMRNELGQFRFYYKNLLGKRILVNATNRVQ